MDIIQTKTMLYQNNFLYYLRMDSFHHKNTGDFYKTIFFFDTENIFTKSDYFPNLLWKKAKMYFSKREKLKEKKLYLINKKIYLA